MKSIQIDKFLRYITALILNIYFALGSQITIDLKNKVPNSGFRFGSLYSCLDVRYSYIIYEVCYVRKLRE